MRSTVSLLFALALLRVSAASQIVLSQLPPKEAPVHVTLRIASEKQRFHIGELVPLEMVFTAEGADYSVITMDRDRDGRRIDCDKFHFSPAAGFSDPLQPYLNVLPQNTMGPSTWSSRMAAGQPQVVTLTLNDWFRFEAPGHYRLSIETNRVSLWGVDGSWKGRVPLVTGEIEFEVIAADPAWQAEQLTEIRTELDHAFPRSDFGVLDPAAFHAIERLRHLDTPESSRELARRLRGENVLMDRECLQGLLTSRAREVAVDEANHLLAQPDFPVSERFLNALCWLLVNPEAGRWPEQHNEYQEAMARTRQQLTNQLAKKRGYALAISLDTLLEAPTRRLTERLDPESRKILISVFDMLPADKQELWVSREWPRVEDPSWIPVLKRLSTLTIDVHFPINTKIFGLLSISSAALKRWYELDPTTARPVVLSEITRAEPRYDANQLGFLTDATLPEAQQAIAEHLVAATDPYVQRNLSGLLARYADFRAAAAILQALNSDPKKLDCLAQVNVAGWLLKTSAPGAPALLDRVFKGCGETVFQQIGNIVEKDENVERLAIRELDNSNLMVAVQALRYIRDYGSARSEQPVWDRFMRWKDKWRNRMSELESHGQQPDPLILERDLGMELPQVLAHARGWLADETKLRNILATTTSESARMNLDVCLQTANQRPVQISYSGVGLGAFTVACYQLVSVQALKDKLLQFPRGTIFIWNDTRSPYFDLLDETIGQQIAEWAAAHGQQITLAPSPWLEQKTDGAR